MEPITASRTREEYQEYKVSSPPLQLHDFSCFEISFRNLDVIGSMGMLSASSNAYRDRVARSNPPHTSGEGQPRNDESGGDQENNTANWQQRRATKGIEAGRMDNCGHFLFSCFQTVTELTFLKSFDCYLWFVVTIKTHLHLFRKSIEVMSSLWLLSFRIWSRTCSYRLLYIEKGLLPYSLYRRDRLDCTEKVIFNQNYYVESEIIHDG